VKRYKISPYGRNDIYSLSRIATLFKKVKEAQGAVYLLTSGQFKRVVFSDLLAAGNGFTDGRKGYPQPPA
jgi:hypothetical protein